MADKARVMEREIKRTLKFRDKEMLNIEISYPQIELDGGYFAQRRINLYFSQKAQRLLRTSIRRLYPQAVRQYLESIRNGYPFNPYQLVSKYTVTFNEECHLSLYTDTYEFTGGAHGTTLRTSDTFDLRTGQRLPLSSFFKRGVNYKKMLIDEIKKIAEYNMSKNPGIYFDNYKELIEKNFNEESYFISPQGINIYYQQYDIAPYSTGIVVFTVPYKTLQIDKPDCK